MGHKPLTYTMSIPGIEGTGYQVDMVILPCYKTISPPRGSTLDAPDPW